MKYRLFTLLLLFALSGCSDNAIVKSFDTDVLENKISCLRLVVFPPDRVVQETLHKLYNFDSNCEYRLVVSQKGGIVCNSNQNAAKKTLSNFPTSYLRMDVSQGSRQLYSYYIDLLDSVSKRDIENGFARVKKDILRD